MSLVLIGCGVGVALILMWWHRVLLVLYATIGLLWFSNRVIDRVLPKKVSHWWANGPMSWVLLLQLRYAVYAMENGIGGHLFDEPD